MKRIFIYFQLLIFSGMIAITTSCNDFLDIDPSDNFSDETFWTSETNLRTYAWKFYDEFLGYGNAGGTTAEFFFLSGGSNTTILSDDLANRDFLNFAPNALPNNTNWENYFKSVRRANQMIEKLPLVPDLTNESRNHWEGVARFFRAYAYFRLVQRFGDVPYYDKAVNSGENTQEIYLPPMGRGEVMDKVLDDLTQAANLMYESEGTNTVNKYVALALKSRAALYEGTYRKYHKLGDGSSYLTQAKQAAFDVIDSKKYTIGTTPDSFRDNYNSEDLGGNTEMILYKEYKLGILAHSLQAYNNTSTPGNGMTKFAIESYVTTNGLPIGQTGGNSEYKGDRKLEDVLANRDPRLLAAVDSEGISYTGITNSISRSRKSSTGYVICLFNNPASTDQTTIGQNATDAPVFIYSEVLLNYAEACAELGNVEQKDLDISVNILRTRVGLPKLVYTNDNDVRVNGITINDPKRTSALEIISGVVPSIIWEIRRERRAELMTWHHIRYFDVLRWHKGEYIDTNNNPDVALGAYIGTIPPGEDIRINSDGYLLTNMGNNIRTFVTPKHYLNSIPTNDKKLYEDNGVDYPQNPGW